MPRAPRKLPKGIRRRSRAGGRYYYEVSFMDRGRRRQVAVGSDLREAKAKLAKYKQAVADGTYRHGTGSTLVPTMDEFAETHWETKRREGLKTVDRMRGDYLRWISPRFGAKGVDEITELDVTEWLLDLRPKMAAKSVRNLFTILRHLLDRAWRPHRLIESNPAAALPSNTLPKISKRKEAPYREDEAWALMTSEVVQADRRMLYQLMRLTGTRLGEACGLRWSDLDKDTLHLWCLTVDSQYNGATVKMARDEDTAGRVVPVHPTLARALDAWRTGGFAKIYGRHPLPDDFISPNPRTMAARTPDQAKKALRRDEGRAGVNHVKGRLTHGMRRCFITSARKRGALPDVVRQITHQAKGPTIDHYTTFEWETLCRAVLCVEVDLSRAPVEDLGLWRKMWRADEKPNDKNEGPRSQTECHTIGSQVNADIKGQTDASVHPLLAGRSCAQTHGVTRATVVEVRRALVVLREGGYEDEAFAVEQLLDATVPQSGLG